jgi:hypothetical protein
MPSAAQGTSAKAAKAFVRYYIDTVNFALKTGDTSALDASSAPGCRSCESVSMAISDVYAADGRLLGRGWRVTAIAAVANQPRSRPILQTGVYVYPQTRIAHSGAEPEHRKGGKNLMIFSLAQRSRTWTVLKWEQSR